MVAARLENDGVSYSFSRSPDLGGLIVRARNQDIITLDNGRREVWSRRLPERRLRVVLLQSPQYERANLEWFFEDIAEGALNYFDFVVEGSSKEVYQCGAEINGAVLLCGATVDGQTFKCGQRVVHDEYRWNRVRFAADSLSVSDSNEANYDIEFELIQELDQ